MKTLVIQIIALIIAGISAIYGIWSGKDMSKEVAWISTGLTVAGIVLGVYLAVNENNKSKEDAKTAQRNYDSLNEKLVEQKTIATKLETQLSLALSNARLRSFVIMWEFENPPENELNKIYILKEAMDHAELMSDDELGRLADDDRYNVLEAMGIRNVVAPIIGFLGKGNVDINAVFSGDIEEALEYFGEGASNWESQEDAWLDIDYHGPIMYPIFPIGKNEEIYVKLGDPSQDEVYKSWQAQENPYLEIMNFGFDFGFFLSEKSMQLSWDYPEESVNRVFENPGDVMATFQDTFRFKIIDENEGGYGNRLDVGNLDELVLDSESAEEWMKNSILTIIPNDIDAAALKYRVERLGVFDRVIELSKYDHPEKEYRYTLFEATKIIL